MLHIHCGDSSGDALRKAGGTGVRPWYLQFVKS